MACRSPCGERGLECCVHESTLHEHNVAPHAGSVDWNIKVTFRDSARTRVAPHAGSVDWNHTACSGSTGNSCRSPCGERGLEYTIGNVTFKSCASLPMRGAWIGINQ